MGFNNGQYPRRSNGYDKGVGMILAVELLERLAFLQHAWVNLLILLCIALIWITSDWRWAWLAFLAQQVLSTVLFWQMGASRPALVHLIGGLFVWVVLVFTAVQLQWGRGYAPAEGLASSRWVRIVGATAGLGIVWLAAGRPEWQLAIAPAPLNQPIFALSGLGAFLALTSEEPWRAGLGLLLFLRGFELYYHTLEQSAALLGLLVGVELMAALATSYLMLARYGTAR